MTITLLGEPKSTQHIYKYACRGNFPGMYMTSEGKAIKESYQWQARSQYRDIPLSEPLGASLRVFFSTKRQHDVDNYNKLILDALTGIVWVDDSQLQELHIYKDYDKEKPRIEITIHTI